MSEGLEEPIRIWLSEVLKDPAYQDKNNELYDLLKGWVRHFASK